MLSAANNRSSTGLLLSGNMFSSKTSPQCRNAFSLSPSVSEFRFQCRDDVSELK